MDTIDAPEGRLTTGIELFVRDGSIRSLEDIRFILAFTEELNRRLRVEFPLGASNAIFRFLATLLFGQVGEILAPGLLRARRARDDYFVLEAIESGSLRAKLKSALLSAAMFAAGAVVAPAYEESDIGMATTRQGAELINIACRETPRIAKQMLQELGAAAEIALNQDGVLRISLAQTPNNFSRWASTRDQPTPEEADPKRRFDVE